MPVVPLQQVQKHANVLRKEYPAIDDDTMALVILHIQTNAPISQIAEKLGADRSWAYSRFARREVQELTARLAMASLGVEAGRSIVTLAHLRDTTKDERTRERIAIELLDRAGLGNTTAQRAQGTGQSFMFSFGAKPQDPPAGS